MEDCESCVCELTVIDLNEGGLVDDDAYESYNCEPKVIESMHRAMIAEWQKNNIPVMKKIWIFVYIW